MLGHKLSQVIKKRAQTFVSVRDDSLVRAHPQFFAGATIIGGVSAQDAESLKRAFSECDPTVVINSIGIVKQLESAKDAVASIGVNSLFPHQLAEMCSKIDARLITISTDCVFSGRKGNYLESDTPDAEDLYGRSKLLGEVQSPCCLTIRTSIIGPQIQGKHSLLEWFLSQQGRTVSGYRNAIFSGWPTLELSKIIWKVISEHKSLSGLYQVASQPISKFDLLNQIKEVYGLDVEIIEDEKFVCNRSLNGSRFEQDTGLKAKPWSQLLQEMCDDQKAYDVSAALARQ